MIGIALNCFDLTEMEALKAIKAVEEQNGVYLQLMSLDFGSEKLVDAIQKIPPGETISEILEEMVQSEHCKTC